MASFKHNKSTAKIATYPASNYFFKVTLETLEQGVKYVQS